jgi:deoxyribodipyrimidine photo-lyase
MWQEYARHVYARLGARTGRSLRFEPTVDEPSASPDDAWDRSMACMESTLGELERDGWLVNQTRMWLASQWTVRHGLDWRAGDDRFFTHLLDGSRAANRLGWQWTIGAGTGKPYGFSRWQVEKRAPELCEGCAHRTACPVEEWPAERTLTPIDEEPRLRSDPDPDVTAGPVVVQTASAPDTVWLTAESLGDADPALASHPELPVVFVFDEPLLRRLRLASKRLLFLTDRLAELATTRAVEIHCGHPEVVLADRKLATTFAPVPKARHLRAALDVAELHPWPWLVRPGSGSIQSFSAWRRGR